MMDIKYRPGSKGDGDRITLIRTNGWHPISHPDLFTLIFLLKQNELRIKKEEIKRNNRFFFREAIIDLLDDKKTFKEIIKEYIGNYVPIKQARIIHEDQTTFDKWFEIGKAKVE